MNDFNKFAVTEPENGQDLNFIYSDTDLLQNEIAELYSYTEIPEFQLNVKAFEDQMELYELPPSWKKCTMTQRKSILMKLMDQLEMIQRDLRVKASRCILYLAQGCCAEIQSDQEQTQAAKENILLLYEHGIFAAFVELLNLEIENCTNIETTKSGASLNDSMDLRVILSVLYHITETIRVEHELKSEEYKDVCENFINEINTPFGDELLAVKLLGMITRFCSGSAPHFPIKKIVLLLWKVSLVSLGGMEILKKLKNDYRLKNNLSISNEDTLEITKTMRASSPPALAADILGNQNPRRNAFRRVRMNDNYLQENLMKQTPLDEPEQMSMEMESEQDEGEVDLSDYYRIFDDPSINSAAIAQGVILGQGFPPPIPKITPLPWQPKVRQKDIGQFLDISRNKFIGYSLINDYETLAGLPQPIHEGMKILKKHMYVSLSEIQIKKEEDITRNPISTREDEIPQTPAEILYQAMLPNLPQNMIALLKILLAASPTSKSKTESINIMADVLPKDMPLTVTESTKLDIDVNRHKEIIVKSISAILLLYLKHFKINHIYQFEFMSQHLVFANCIPLILKFFNQDIMEYVGSKNSIPIMDFPSCVLGEQTELTSDDLLAVIGDSSPYSWRNLFSCINLLRILNKLIKWKHSRVMMLVVFKSAPILKKTLKVRHAMMQLYVLKLLKMQTKYLGRQWRKSNMKVISAIYSKVRHRLNDDWAFGNDLESRPWDFQAEECTLRKCVDRFNNRRYSDAMRCQTSLGNDGGPNDVGQQDFGDLDYFENEQQFNNNVNTDYIFGSIETDKKIELTDDFKANYELWLHENVYNRNIDWDLLKCDETKFCV